MAPTGTVTVSCVGVAAVTVARVAPKKTMLLAGVALKFVPVSVRDVLTGPKLGVKEEMVGSKGEVTVKLLGLLTVLQSAVTATVPVVAPDGTVVVMLVAVLAVTIAVVPLNLTLLLAGVALKFVPMMVMVVPTLPLGGLNEVMVGKGVTTVKLSVLITVG